MDMGEFLEFYCANNNKELEKIVNNILINEFGWLPKQHYEDFYSVAAQAVWQCEQNFDKEKLKSKNFKSYVKSCIHNKILSQFTHMHRDKRCLKDNNGTPMYEVSLDAPVGDDERLTIEDIIQSDFDIDIAVSKDINDLEECSENIKEFIASLPDVAKKIVKMIMQDYEVCDIKNMLQITDKQYKDYWSIICLYDKKRILYKENNREDESMEAMVVEGNVTEKYKNTSYSIESISKQLRKKKIRDDHILQRHSGQWKGFAKSELISDILRGKSLTQIIISEEIKAGIKMQWLIDGKQRCTTLDDFLHNGFAISKNVKNYNIKYQTPKFDENGNEVLNEEGFPDMDWKTFDIRGKKFSQLPEDLQDIFKDRQIPVLYNMDCTKKDIADDIARFNRSRPMNKAQNGWLGLDEEFAELAGNIAKMPFFQPGFAGSTYTSNNETAGAIRRIIVESIMVSDFIDDFKSFEEMCEFLSEEASDANFTEFYSLVERLTVICNTKEIAALFNAKDSFLWFGLFSRFTKLGLEDKRFADFMNNFKTLRAEKIDGESFDDILGAMRSTKDKSVVVKKIDYLELLMKKYLLVEETQKVNISDDGIDDMEAEAEIMDNETFIASVLGIDRNEVTGDMDVYNETLTDLTDKTIKDGSKLLEAANKPSLLAMVAHSYKEEVDLDEWMAEYAKNNNTYFTNQKRNYLHMKQDFERFLLRTTKSA